MLFILSNIKTESCTFEYKFCVLLEVFGITIDKIELLFKRFYLALKRSLLLEVRGRPIC